MEATMGKVRNKKGLTLIELLAVVLIIGIIAAIAVPAVSNAIEKSKTNADLANQRLILDAGNRYALEKAPTVTTTIPVNTPTLTTGLVQMGYLNSVPKFNSTSHNVTDVKITITTNTNGLNGYKVELVGPTEDLTK